MSEQLHASGVLQHDLAETLVVLNEARKVAVYEGDDPEFESRSLESIATEVEAAVEMAEREDAP